MDQKEPLPRQERAARAKQAAAAALEAKWQTVDEAATEAAITFYKDARSLLGADFDAKGVADALRTEAQAIEDDQMFVELEKAH